MKVVLFCGGLGTRLKEYSETTPKSLVNIGYRPILWHLMRYYAHFGHKDFVLCLGYRGDMIKQFFLSYNECVSNDFIMRTGGADIELFQKDIDEWTITFVETGLHTNIGQRLVAVRPHLEGEDFFLANYADGLTDLPLDTYIDTCCSAGAVASFLSVKSRHSFHVASCDPEGWVTAIEPIQKSPQWLNSGFFVLSNDIFNYLDKGDDLVEKPFARLIAERKLFTHQYEGFWMSMDTFKDKITFDRMYGQGLAPWELWNQREST